LPCHAETREQAEALLDAPEAEAAERAQRDAQQDAGG
jgi:hypothetical protein